MAGTAVKEALRLFHCHIQHIGNGFALEQHFQRFAVIALALAGFAGDIDIGQKVHLDLQHPIALTGLAPPALDVEGKPPRLIAARLGFGQAREPVADRAKRAGIGGRVGTRGAANRALVNVDHLVQHCSSPLMVSQGAGVWRAPFSRMEAVLNRFQS
jgi:hypothetical protein